MINVKRGLDVPIFGEPEQQIEAANPVKTVAIVAHDYHGMKPKMQVQEGDRVVLGQVLFSDKKNPDVVYTAPGSGIVQSINRGEKRVFQSIVISLDESNAQPVSFSSYAPESLNQLSKEEVCENLQTSGLWTAFRTRPYSKVPATNAIPHSIFVTAIDTHPLAADPSIVIAQYVEDFSRGLELLSRIAKVFLCKDINANLPGEQISGVQIESFSGVHPAGLAGTHIHFLDPVSLSKTVWAINYQDVIAIGKLFITGNLWVERVISLAGPVVIKPRLLLTRLGACLSDLTHNELLSGNNRVVSGSLLGGKTAVGVVDFLGRYHLQVSCLAEGCERELLHYLRAGVNKHSNLNIFVSKLLGRKKFSFSTTTNGSPRAMVPVGNYESIMPLDILATQLLRYLIIGDTEMAQKLGCLELDEEDLALCSYVCAGKYEYGPILRDNLTNIEKEG
ncbi:UNVERIFIED_CONTAM: hypothetical protein GTU68_005041 [Idotea baltica]|nr:hypothetical protein [Idotea baltica]